MIATTEDLKTKQNQVEELYQIFENFSANTPFPDKPAGLYNAVRHIMSIQGKRLRPVLLMASAEMFGANANDAVSAAAAVEWYHNSTLVHDDIMDEADIRRGIPTVHKVYGVNTAINTGDVMIIKAYELLARLSCEQAKKTISIFSKAAAEIIEGQTMDLDFETRSDVSETEYLKMIEFKTSVLLAAALEMGAAIGGASDDDSRAVYEFGRSLGISFQIKDDWLDTFGEADKIGKKVGGDIARNKRTLLYLRAINKANPTQKQKLIELGNEADTDLKIKETLNVFAALNIKEDVSNTAAEYFNQSLDHLDSINISGERKTILRDLANRIYNRDF
jgi:geranylgeranyl diphosphate synthase, type II